MCPVPFPVPFCPLRVPVWRPGWSLRRLEGMFKIELTGKEGRDVLLWWVMEELV